jgi:hypothetical protein
MTVISISLLAIIVLALLYTYWCLIKSLVEHFRLHWLPLTLVIIFFLGLSGGLLFIIFHLFMADSINAGTLLGMLFGIALILGTIRTFRAT